MSVGASTWEAQPRFMASIVPQLRAATYRVHVGQVPRAVHRRTRRCLQKAGYFVHSSPQ